MNHRHAVVPLIPLVVLMALLPGCASERAPEVDTMPGSVAPPLLFEGATLIPGSGAPAIENSGFLVQDGVITRVGRMEEFEIPSGTVRVDLRGKTVMPALIGAHGHPGYQEGLTFSSDVYSRETLLADLARAAFFGVGTVLSMGIDPGELVFEIRDETGRGEHGGARLLTAGRGIGAPNAGPGFATWAGIAYEVTTEETGRAAVRELADRQVDMVKIWVDDRGGRAPALAPEVYRAILEEAASLGLPVTAHVFYHSDTELLVEAGVHGLAHMARDEVMSDALVADIVRRGVFVMPNLGGAERSRRLDPPWEEDLQLLTLLEQTVQPAVLERMHASFTTRTPEAAEAARERYAILEASVAKLAEAGAKLLVGPDTGLSDHFFGYAEQRELELLVEAGMTPAQVIVAATSRGAEYLGLENTGLLAEGRAADFLILDANPLDDIRHTRHISAVYLGGREVDRGTSR